MTKPVVKAKSVRIIRTPEDVLLTIDQLGMRVVLLQQRLSSTREGMRDRIECDIEDAKSKIVALRWLLEAEQDL